MANRRLNQFHYNNVGMLSSVFAQVTFGASGAPTLNNGGAFISGIVRNSAGDYTLTFRDVWPQLLGVRWVFNSGSSLPAAPLMNIKDNSTATAGTQTMEIVFSDADTPAATDPASGEIVYLEFVFNNSSVTNG